MKTIVFTALLIGSIIAHAAGPMDMTKRVEESTTIPLAEGQILLGLSATEMETYAARELQRCLFQLSGVRFPILGDDAPLNKPTIAIGRPENNRLIRKLHDTGEISVSENDPGPQGYLLKRLTHGGQTVFVITGSDKEGVLYGTYGLLDDHLGVGFYFSGDIFPENKTPISLGNLDEKKAPRQYIRGVLPWMNFPTSATSYSFEDYKYVLDQMAKMRFNLLHLHNYWGYWNCKEAFHNVTFNGITPRLQQATAATGHVWAGPGWNVNRYRFGASDLFGDYDFGSDVALHNEGLDNLAVSRKGANLFKRVIEYAHIRGIKIALGLEIDTVPAELKTPADNPGLVDARTAQLISDYPDLDYLLCYRNEVFAPVQEKIWYAVFDRIYNTYKAKAPKTRIGISGWGLDGAAAAKLPLDVIAAPIAHYGPTMEDGTIYGMREYWGCPWVENDGNNPYLTPSTKWGSLGDTVKAYGKHATNMLGFTTLTWRITDSMDPKLSYIAKAPWDRQGKYATSRDLYLEYAVRVYGPAAGVLLADILDKDDRGIIGWGECIPTPQFKGTDQTNNLAHADRLLAAVDAALAVASGKGERAKLENLRRRFLRYKAYCQLEQSAGKDEQAWRTFAHAMAHSVEDISSLGNNVSLQNRFVQQRMPKNITDGPSPLVAPLVKVISAPSSGYAGQPLELVAIVLDNEPHEKISATIHYRALDEESFRSLMMTRRTKAIFAARIPGAEITPAGLGYYVEATDGKHTSYWPVAAPQSVYSCTVLNAPAGVAPPAPVSFSIADKTLSWAGGGEETRYFRIYRSTEDKCLPSRATYLTFVDKETKRFADLANDFKGLPLKGDYWYRITAVDNHGRESEPTAAINMRTR